MEIKIVFFLTTLFFVHQICAATEPKDARSPRPDNVAVSKVFETLEKLYGHELDQVKQQKKQTAMAHDLFSLAKETNNDPAAQFVLLYTARNMAAEAKDWGMVMEIIDEIAKRFQPAAKVEPDIMIHQGEKLCEAANDEPLKERLIMRLNAAEWFAYAKENGGLQGKLAEKRLRELGEEVGGKKNIKEDARDCKMLVGTWEITATNSYHGYWTFFPDGTVQNDKSGKGSWIIEPTKIRITWNEQAWETFNRPLGISIISGDSWKGAGIIKARKIH